MRGDALRAHLDGDEWRGNGVSRGGAAASYPLTHPNLGSICPRSGSGRCRRVPVGSRRDDLVCMHDQPAPRPSHQPALPSGRVAWRIYALVTLILAASSVAPFVQLGSGWPRVSRGDLWTVSVYLATWAPFVAALLWLGISRRAGAQRTQANWFVYLAMLLLSPAAHSLAFFATEAAMSGTPFSIADALAGPAFKVLTLLGTLQFLVLVSVLIAVLAGTAADDSRLRAAELELEQERLGSQLARARVDSLTAQLHPHFLFNTLNSISVLAGSDPPAAQLMVRQLSSLLRAVLDGDDHPTVPLARELELLRAYVEIQRVRFGDRLRVQMNIDDATLQCLVPTLILQPLVENAIHYAVSEREAGGSIVVSARRAGARLALEVRDDGPGASGPGDLDRPQHADGTTGRGVGHRNTRERLVQLYAHDHLFTATYGESTPGCSVKIELPFTLDAGATDA
jgi:signal transduction histidine kinase